MEIIVILITTGNPAFTRCSGSWYLFLYRPAINPNVSTNWSWEGLVDR